MSNIKILVATHKEYEFPNSKMYQPIHVGKAINSKDFGIIGDNTNINISLKNPNFCELTALYWAWKNIFFNKYDYCGLAHYRRYFVGKSLQLKSKFIISEEELLFHLKDCDIILPKKRNYYIENIETHYKNAHYEKDLLETKKIISEKYPEFLNSFEITMSQKKLFLYNMFVMKTNEFEKYCEWLFDILFELERRIDISNYSSYQGRVFGFLSERLFNIWILQKKYITKELKTVNIDGENLFLKAIGLLERKFLKNKA